MSENTVNEQKMLTIDRNRFIGIVKAFSKEEWDIVIRLADTRKIKEEYFRRTDAVWGLYEALQNTMSDVNKNSTTEEMEDVIKALRNLLNKKE